MDQSNLVNESLTAAAGAAMKRHHAEKRIKGPKAVMPGGRIVDATPYLQNQHRTQKQSTTFADVDEHPERYFKDPKPGYRYVWVRKGDPESEMKIQIGQYEPVKRDDLLPESRLPLVPGTPTVAGTTHSGAKGNVEIYDLKLCRVSPVVWDELYASREAEAVARIASGTETFYNNMEREGAIGSVEVTDDNGNPL